MDASSRVDVADTVAPKQVIDPIHLKLCEDGDLRAQHFTAAVGSSCYYSEVTHSVFPQVTTGWLHDRELGTKNANDIVAPKCNQK